MNHPALKYLAWIIWLSFAIIMVVFADHHRTVSVNYWQAAQHWLTQQPLYQNTGRGFIYLPQSALLYAPLTTLPYAVSEAIWRLLSLGIFSWGLFRFTALLLVNHQQNRWPVFFLLLTALAIPLCFDSVRNGQMHLLVTGLLMLAAASVCQSRWRQATFLIVLAFFLKPTAIVFLLLTAGVFLAETWIYFLIWMALFLVLPLVTQSWHYVLAQYQACFTMLTVAATAGNSQDWAQFFNLVSQLGWEMPQLLQTIVRVIVAVLFLGIGFYIKRRSSLRETIIWLLMLSMSYLMLFNPRTENNDYMMLIPVLGYCFVNNILCKKYAQLGFLILITAGLISSYYLSNLFPGHRNWSAPLMGLLLLGYLILSSKYGKMAALTDRGHYESSKRFYF